MARQIWDSHSVMRTKDEVETMSLFSPVALPVLNNLSVFTSAVLRRRLFSPCGVSPLRPAGRRERRLITS